MTLRRAARLAAAPALAATALVAGLTGTAGAASAEPTAPTLAPAAAATETADAAATTASARYLVGASIAAPELGKLPIQRVFRDKIGKPLPYKTVLSFRTWDDAAVRSFVRTAPAGTHLVWAHEPEDEITHGKMSASAWAGRVVDLTRVIKQEGRVGQVVPSTVLMRWTLAPQSHRGQMLATLLSPAVVEALRSTHGVLAWDSYAGPKSTRTPQDMYGVPAAYSASRGLPWAIAETGANRSDATRWTQTFRYLDTMGNQPRFFMAWNPEDLNRGVFAVQNQPAVAAVWRTAIATHRG